MCFSEWWEYHQEIVVDCDRNVRGDIIYCLIVMETTPSKIFVEGLIGRMHFLNGSGKVIHYGYIKLARAMDKQQLYVILPLRNSEMKSASEKVLEIMNFVVFIPIIISTVILNFHLVPQAPPLHQEQ
jgi:hypothetical protein